MTSVQALRCDAIIVPTPSRHLPYMASIADRIECPAISRNARTPNVLGTLAERDGWLTRPDGTHLCPSCAAAAREAAA